MVEIDATAVREGDLLAGKYRVGKVLGAGGMGIVVAARHEQLDQLVAIKLVRDKSLGKNEEAVARFLREARAAVKLRSAHVAKVLDVGTLESGAPFMVMEHLDGADLGAVLAAHGALSLEVAALYVLQACEAVAEAHAAGIIHRDLKPQNLFLTHTVTGAACVKVLDFGVSKTLINSGDGGLTQTRSMLGSPLYMSPEQMRSSRHVDARSDVWALGAVLFELLTTRLPFEAETMPELCLKVTTESPQPLTSFRSDLPPAMVDLVARCLAKDPAERFADAAELALALDPFVPPESRAHFERRPSSGRAAIVSIPMIATAEPFAQTAPTPAAWDSGKRSAGGAETQSGGKWIGGGIAVAALVAGGIFLLRAHDTAAPSSASQAPLVSGAVTAASAPVVAGAVGAVGATTAPEASTPRADTASNAPSASERLGTPLPSGTRAAGGATVSLAPSGHAGAAHGTTTVPHPSTPVASALATAAAPAASVKPHPNIKVLDDGDSP